MRSKKIFTCAPEVCEIRTQYANLLYVCGHIKYVRVNRSLLL